MNTSVHISILGGGNIATIANCKRSCIHNVLGHHGDSHDASLSYSVELAWMNTSPVVRDTSAKELISIVVVLKIKTYHSESTQTHIFRCAKQIAGFAC